MRTLQQLRLEFITYKIGPYEWLGDSPSRLDFYTEVAKGCDRILELGVYSGLSTTAFMLSQPKSLLSIDITDQFLSIKDELVENAKINGIDYNFVMTDDLTYEPFEHDMLFVDTTHTYEQTMAELNRFGPHARKKIVLHDMRSAFGVYNAVFQWLWENPQFHLVHHDARGDGVAVLERYTGS